ncbi:hypothetical protein PIB30_014032 [Stylosanthes scabra]|uniref:Uncharacterized protein n=1 Tax=Stylosanthes scabra TaxID=79078 RepID=A0ABU6Z353_9FABA|nr:hypothetical protein [Stylosanthes scabra]
MALGLTMDSGAIQNGRSQPHISDVPFLGVVHDLDRAPRPSGDDNTVVRMTCTLLLRKDDRDLARKTVCGYKKKGRDELLPVDGHFPFPNRILRIQLPRHFIKPTDMKPDGSIDRHEHLKDFEHRIICDRVIDEVKCRVFPVTLAGLASKWFTLSTGFIPTFIEKFGKGDIPEAGNSKSQNQRDEDEKPTTVINVITNSNAVKESKCVLKKDLKILTIQTPPTCSNMKLGKEDCRYGLADADAPTVISAKLGSGLVRRILVANSNIMFRNAFDALGFKDGDLKAQQPIVMGLGDHFIKPDGSIELPITIEKGNARKMTMAEFVILQD